MRVPMSLELVLLEGPADLREHLALSFLEGVVLDVLDHDLNFADHSSDSNGVFSISALTMSTKWWSSPGCSLHSKRAPGVAAADTR
jgi:hypothetical protein